MNRAIYRGVLQEEDDEGKAVFSALSPTSTEGNEDADTQSDFDDDSSS